MHNHIVLDIKYCILWTNLKIYMSILKEFLAILEPQSLHMYIHVYLLSTNMMATLTKGTALRALKEVNYR